MLFILLYDIFSFLLGWDIFKKFAETVLMQAYKYYTYKKRTAVVNSLIYFLNFQLFLILAKKKKKKIKNSRSQ